MMRTVAFAVLCAVASVCNATTYYVSTSGSDENDGLSLETAFSSLARAVDAAGADEAEILIAPGTYEQSAAIRVEAPPPPHMEKWLSACGWVRPAVA